MASCEVVLPTGWTAEEVDRIIDVEDCGGQGVVTDLRLRLVRDVWIDVFVTSATIGAHVTDDNDLEGELPDPLVSLAYGGRSADFTECVSETYAPTFDSESALLTAPLTDLVLGGLDVAVHDGDFGGFPPVPCGLLDPIASCSAPVSAADLGSERVVSCGEDAPEVRLRFGAPRA
jgi:hypothetical protein